MYRAFNIQSLCLWGKFSLVHSGNVLDMIDQRVSMSLGYDNGIQFLEYQTFILKIYLKKHEFHTKYRTTRFDKF
jgi:hypothetical protein